MIQLFVTFKAVIQVNMNIHAIVIATILKTGIFSFFIHTKQPIMFTS